MTEFIIGLVNGKEYLIIVNGNLNRYKIKGEYLYRKGNVFWHRLEKIAYIAPYDC